MKKLANSISTLVSIRNVSVSLVMLAAFVMLSCDKDHRFDFTKSTGPIVTIDRQLDSQFNGISMKDDVNVVLTMGDHFDLKLEGGKNLLPGIKTEVKDNILILSNSNTYNWVRSYDKEITAYLTVPSLLDIKYESTGNLTSTDTIVQDSLRISVNGGSGYIDLNIITGTVKMSLISGSADLKLRGTTGLSFIFQNGVGAIRCYDLLANYIFMRNSGTNNCEVYVREHLEYEITGSGDILYKGKPIYINGNSTGAGKLIKVN